VDDRIEGDDPLANFSPTAAHHLRRTDGFADVADIMIGSFYDPQLDEGCAFEELISFHGGLGGQTRPFVLYPSSFRLPDEPLVGAAAVHGLCEAGASSAGRASRRQVARIALPNMTRTEPNCRDDL
jgi:hypothetical protein